MTKAKGDKSGSAQGEEGLWRLHKLATAAVRLDCSVRELRRLIKRGEIVASCWARTMRISEADLREFMARSRRVKRT